MDGERGGKKQPKELETLEDLEALASGLLS